MRLLLATVSLFQLSIISLYQCVQIKTMTHLNDIPFYFQFGDFFDFRFNPMTSSTLPTWSLTHLHLNKHNFRFGFISCFFHFRFTPMTSSTLPTWSLTHLRLNKHNFRFGSRGINTGSWLVRSHTAVQYYLQNSPPRRNKPSKKVYSLSQSEAC